MGVTRGCIGRYVEGHVLLIYSNDSHILDKTRTSYVGPLVILSATPQYCADGTETVRNSAPLFSFSPWVCPNQNQARAEMNPPGERHAAQRLSADVCQQACSESAAVVSPRRQVDPNCNASLPDPSTERASRLSSTLQDAFIHLLADPVHNFTRQGHGSRQDHGAI